MKQPTPEQYLEYLETTEEMLEAQLKVIQQQKKMIKLTVDTKEFLSMFNPLTFLGTPK
jgi:hypothetical protein